MQPTWPLPQFLDRRLSTRRVSGAEAQHRARIARSWRSIRRTQRTSVTKLLVSVGMSEDGYKPPTSSSMFLATSSASAGSAVRVLRRSLTDAFIVRLLREPCFSPLKLPKFVLSRFEIPLDVNSISLARWAWSADIGDDAWILVKNSSWMSRISWTLSDIFRRMLKIVRIWS